MSEAVDVEDVEDFNSFNSLKKNKKKRRRENECLANETTPNDGQPLTSRSGL